MTSCPRRGRRLRASSRPRRPTGRASGTSASGSLPSGGGNGPPSPDTRWVTVGVTPQPGNATRSDGQPAVPERAIALRGRLDQGAVLVPPIGLRDPSVGRALLERRQDPGTVRLRPPRLHQQLCGVVPLGGVRTRLEAGRPLVAV